MWESYEFPDTIAKINLGRKHQIKASEIQPSGQFPVVDQGQDLIAGFTDEASKVITDNLPLIVFGDHTRCVKYIDFPFVIGADGTKVLKPDPKLFDSKFYYYALLGLDIPSRGYNRHFTLLKEKRIPRPEPDEQRRIASVLTMVQNAITQQEGLIALTGELKRALMHKLFTEGLRGEEQKQTALGLVPESWSVAKIGDVFKFSSGKPRPPELDEMPSEAKPYPVYGGNGIMGYSSEYLLESPTVVLGRVGEYCGCSHHTQGRAWISDNALYVKETKTKVNTEFAAEYFNYANLNQYSNKGGQPLITQGVISSVFMPLPEKEEQDVVSGHLRLLNKKAELMLRKKTLLGELFRTLLHQLMTAQIRVSNLEL